MITIADLPYVEAHATALGQAAYEAWAMCQPYPVAPWRRLSAAGRFIWVKVALAAIGGSLEFAGVDLAPAEVRISGGLH